jgi:hypothetical protein
MAYTELGSYPSIGSTWFRSNLNDVEQLRKSAKGNKADRMLVSKSDYDLIRKADRCVKGKIEKETFLNDFGDY